MQENMVNRLKRQVYGKKVTGYVLLFAISAVFVLFGYAGKTGNLGVGSVARVNDAVISFADFQQEEERIRQYYSQMFGGAMDFTAQRHLLQRQAVENLVQGELVYQAVQKEGIYATDAEVRDFIVTGVPFFQEKGVFQRDRYLGYLQATRSNPADFETKIRKDISSIRTRRMIEIAMKPLSLESAKLKELHSTQMNLSFVVLNEDLVAKSMNISDAAAGQALLDAGFVKIAEEHFKTYGKTYDVEEQVQASHILIQAKNGDAKAEEAALKKIQMIAERAKKEDFGKLAQEFSEDPGSKTKKGDLGYFTKGKMVKEFDDVAFSGKPGQISAPVKTQFGYHLIKVLDHKAEKKAEFSAVKMAIAKKLIAQSKYQEALKSIESALAKNDSAAVESLVKGLGMNWEETGFFDLAADQVPKLNGTSVVEAAFQVSEEKPILPRFVQEAGGKYILKLKGFKKADSVAATEPQNDQRRRSNAVFMAWLESFRKDSKIIVNPGVITQQ